MPAPPGPKSNIFFFPIVPKVFLNDFKAAASKAGYETTPAGLKEFANKVMNDPNASDKLKKKANFYLNVVSK